MMINFRRSAVVSAYACSRGFSLVELLVVLAITAALFAILLPSLQKARETAHVMGCASNLRQMGIAMQAYVADQRDGALPWTSRWNAGWAVRMTPYIGSPHAGLRVGGNPDDNDHNPTVFRNYSIFRCPENRLKTGPNYYNYNYGYNARLTAGVTTGNSAHVAAAWLDRKTMYRITYNPSKIIMINDQHVLNFLGIGEINATITYATGPRMHLNQKINMLFLDGHVELVGKGQHKDLTTLDKPDVHWQ